MCQHTRELHRALQGDCAKPHSCGDDVGNWGRYRVEDLDARPGDMEDSHSIARVAILKQVSKVSREYLHKAFGIEVNDMLPYYTAFIHRSMHKKLGISQERLELLGDAVLGLVTAEDLYNSYSNENEGFLTKARTKIVNGRTLTHIADQMGIEDLVVMSTNASNIKKGNASSFKRISEDTLEALIGAIFVDKGLDACRSFLKQHIIQRLPSDILTCEDNYKDMLIKRCAEIGDRPVYEISMCPDSTKRFVAIVRTSDGHVVLGHGVAESKKEAEKCAAANALTRWN